MFYPDSFKVSAPSDFEIEVTRDFHAPRALVFDAFTRPELVRRWLLGPPGWDMGMGGFFREIAAPRLLVATERFDDSWYPGDALNTTVFTETGEITNVTVTVRYESKEARDTARRSGMEHGMAAGYNRLEELLAAEESGE